MCYNKYKYKMLPEKAYSIIRNCGGCGCKTNYVSTNEFRVNANGNKVDVWLIYQCEKCKHTYNLSIHERVRPNEIKAEYDKFLANDQVTALAYGTDKSLFIRNKAEIDTEHVTYVIHKEEIGKELQIEDLQIFNPYELKIRTDKVVAEILNLSRSEVKDLVRDKKIIFDKRYIGKQMSVCVKFQEIFDTSVKRVQHLEVKRQELG